VMQSQRDGKKRKQTQKSQRDHDTWGFVSPCFLICFLVACDGGVEASRRAMLLELAWFAFIFFRHCMAQELAYGRKSSDLSICAPALSICVRTVAVSGQGSGGITSPPGPIPPFCSFALTKNAILCLPQFLPQPHTQHDNRSTLKAEVGGAASAQPDQSGPRTAT